MSSPSQALTEQWKGANGHFLWRIAALVGLLLATESILRAATALPEDAYFSSVLLVELVRSRPWMLAAATLAIGSALWYCRSLGPAWPADEDTRFIRPLVLAISLVLTWAFTTYEYNLYFGHSHIVDRVVLIALLLLLSVRPIFIVPWLLLFLVLLGQFNHPFGGFSWAEPFQLVRMLLLFTGLLVLRITAGRWYTVEYYFVLVCLIASAYWGSGVGKLRLDWLGYGPHLHNLIFSTYANGWLRFLSPATVLRFGQLASRFIWPLMAFTLLVEVGALFILAGRRLVPLFLGGFILFHLGIFTFSGIFFWKWIVVEAVLLILLLRNSKLRRAPIYTRRHALLSMVVIAGSAIWFKPVTLAWYDAPLNYVYRFEATGVSGRHYALEPSFFRPYDYQFTLSDFSFMTADATLPIVWGATRTRPVAEALLAVDSVEEVLGVERALGENHRDPSRAALFDAFLTTFVGNWNERRSKSSGLSLLQAPPHLWTFAVGTPYRNQEPITSVTVVQVTAFFDGSSYQEIRRRPVHITEIPVH